MTLASHWVVYTTSQMYVGNDLLGVTRTGGNALTTAGRNAYVPLVASGSFFFYAKATASATTVGQVLRNTATGVTVGTLRTSLRVNEVVPAGLGEAGILCMQSQSNLTIGGGNGYGLAWQGPQNGTGGPLTLFQFSGGLSNQAALSANAFSFTSGTAVVIQLAWVVSGSTVTLRAQAGLGTSYGTLSALYSAVILASAFTTTLGEGFYAMQRNNNLSALDVTIDVTERTE